MAFQPDAPCCKTLKEVLAGPGSGGEPTVFLDDDDVMMMVIGMIDTPGGLALYDHPVHHCPFCGASLQSATEIRAKAKP